MNITGAVRRYGFWGAMRRVPGSLRRRLGRRRDLLLGRVPVKTAYGVRLFSNWGDTTFEMCVEGSFGPFLADLLRRYERRFVFLDVGANQGLYSLIAAENPQCAHVYAFEPVLPTFDLLERNIRLNKMAARITPLPFGVSDSDGTSQIAVPRTHSGAASIHHVPEDSTPLNIQLKTAPSFADTIQPDDLPLLVKIDVEGHEPEVLSQLMDSTLAPRLDTLFYEVDEDWVDPQRLRDILGEQTFSFSKVGESPHFDMLAVRKNRA